MTIENAGQYRAHAARRNEIIDRHVQMGFEFSLTMLITAVRSQEDFPIKTANLLHSVGVARRIAKSPRTMGSLPRTATAVDVRGCIRRRAEKYYILFGVGMEYASPVEERTGFLDKPLSEAPAMFQEGFRDSMNNAVKEIERVES